jgi:small-conductance mechanosensitive channel
MDQIVEWLARSNINLFTIIVTAAVLLATPLAILSLNRLLRRLISRADARRHLPYATVPTLTRLVAATLWLVAALLVMDLWGISVTGLWTLLAGAIAVIGVGFLAVWTMVSNVTASFLITVWRPFTLGQTVELLPENLKGRVVDRNLMFVVLREASGSVIQIPNNLFFQKVFRVSEGHTLSLFETLEHEAKSAAGKPRIRGEGTNDGGK